MRPLPMRPDHRATPAPSLAPIILLLGLALVALAARARAEITFDTPFLAKGNAVVNRWLTVGDFNGDGHLDVATGVQVGFPFTISILLGRGDGTFTIGTPVPMTVNFGYLEAGDVNGDGFVDLVTANSGANVSVLLGHGDGTFGSRTDYATLSSGIGRIITIADLNLDGIADVIVGSSIFPGQAGSTLGARIDLPFGTAAVGDVNGDGKPDVLSLGGGSTSVLCRLGHGDFTFDPPTTVYTAASGTVSQAFLADVNGDGKLDAVLVHSGDFVVCLGNGNGTFGPAADFPCSNPAMRAVTGDFNGDGRADVAGSVSVSLGGYVMCRLGQADGSLGPEQVFAAGGQPLYLEEGDMNEDGRDDFLSATDGGGSVSVALSNGDGTLGHLAEYSVGVYPSDLQVGDLNGDGHTDVIAISDSDSVAVAFGDGAGHLGAPLRSRTGFASTASALGDLDGDGRLDLILARANHPDNSADSSVAFLGGNGDGTFRAPIVTKAGVQPDEISIVKANGDASPDLAIIGYSNCSVLLGNGDGTFQAPIVTSTGSRTVATFADLDGDGIVDLVAVGADTAVVEFGAGDGTFGSPVRIPSPGVVDAAAGDLDGDGKCDLVLSTGTFPPIHVSIWKGAGGHTFAPGASYDLPYLTSLDGLVDFDHDGRLDLVFVGGPNTLKVLPGNGDATFSMLPAEFGLSHELPYSNNTRFADLDGDGLPEVLAGDIITHAISVLRNRSTGTSAVPVKSQPTVVASLVRVTPNPAAGDRLSVSFSLAGREAARLEVFDIAGRRVRSLDVTKFGPGLHQADLAAGRRIAPGLYVLRLSQNGKVWTARAAVVE